MRDGRGKKNPPPRSRGSIAYSFAAAASFSVLHITLLLEPSSSRIYSIYHRRALQPYRLATRLPWSLACCVILLRCLSVENYAVRRFRSIFNQLPARHLRHLLSEARLRFCSTSTPHIRLHDSGKPPTAIANMNGSAESKVQALLPAGIDTAKWQTTIQSYTSRFRAPVRRRQTCPSQPAYGAIALLEAAPTVTRRKRKVKPAGW
ncbi:hypothetical protein B0T24DRAFT_628177 [Lasiosphaeria ovina]|uniref:Uncharacterized protein n=1 Tax=Lasiosphaeria ovina TaxID=92902 RepID=A0AAE0N5P9_9PEZI|nr:hypothetical protein B0T24DRAFT_628177 [Lasiosphaeria ovina]